MLYKEVLRKFWTIFQNEMKKKKKRNKKKINFINLFGLEVKKIIFLDFTRCKTEEK